MQKAAPAALLSANPLLGPLMDKFSPRRVAVARAESQRSDGSGREGGGTRGRLSAARAGVAALEQVGRETHVQQVHGGRAEPRGVALQVGVRENVRASATAAPRPARTSAPACPVVSSAGDGARSPRCGGALEPEAEDGGGLDASSTLAALRDELRSRHTRVLDLFRECDADSSGFVDAAELRGKLGALGLHTGSAQDDDELFALLDADGDRRIAYDELHEALRKRADIVLPARLRPGAVGAIETESKNATELRH